MMSHCRCGAPLNRSEGQITFSERLVSVTAIRESNILCMELSIEVPLYPSESEERVMRAVSALVDLKYTSQERKQDAIILRSDDVRALRPLKEALERQLTRAAARSILAAGLRERYLEFRLHKQAAYVKRASFVTEEGESPLGPIKVTVKGETNELNDIISYLTGAPPKRFSRNLPTALARARACLICSG